MSGRDGTEKIVLLGQVPSKKNSRINTRSGRSFPSKRYSEWHKNSVEQLGTIDGSFGKGITSQKCEINYMFYCKDLRRRDVSNMLESINDLLVDVGILEDDDWKHVRIGWADATVDKEKPRAEVTIKQYGGQNT